MSNSKQFGFGFLDKALFYTSYLLNKTLFIWFEVKSPKLRMFAAEFLYSVGKVIRLKESILDYRKVRIDSVETIFGKFKTRPGTMDIICVSPAFERPDLDHLLEILSKNRSFGKKILFLDIGADIGTYAISVANRFNDIDVIAFEPTTVNRRFLLENIALNKRQIEVVPKALGQREGIVTIYLHEENPGGNTAHAKASQPAAHKETVEMVTLDSLLGGRAQNYDLVVFKIDVEGMEKDVLEGSNRVLSSGVDCIFMVEDFVDGEIIKYLHQLGAEFVTKKTPYNSFWRISSLI
ncbi:hypothetical protein A2704_03460 [Candidatus Kaiserbacteria bacterium RIFCSPHIGHO2_01_FULL_54_36b]|uniref:Methyltransferase FkbM domain-containing protein n=1 Tax=Candidatus Kaiserbacteria bacterium RIFCSPHIGHO2_01_FULL_54_36b TaxID=1798483 RepID=A0A1F6CQE1_9BACT|nr:MAG: hypothetical protein A2704_03460 [Candidatus Kaiserbacteria bacterium RIFCSPHIGHO2_01_FULL_54_36b]